MPRKSADTSVVRSVASGEPAGEASQTLSDQTFERILDLIYTCRLRPGDAINESALAARFGISRGPVREAVRRLQGIHVVTREPYLKARVSSLTPAAVTQLFQIRAALEGLACRLAASQLKDDEIVILFRDLDAARRVPTADPTQAPSRLRFDFHERIARASGNERLYQMLFGSLYHMLRVYRTLSGAVPERKEAAYAEHWQVLRAIAHRDGDLAESLMRSHIERAAGHVVAHVQAEARRSAAPSFAA